MVDAPVTGARSYVIYRKEATFGTDPGGTSYAFGHEINFNAQAKNNLIEVLGLNDRNVKALLAGKFEGMITIDGVLANGRWLGMTFGTSATTGSTPYKHTFTESNTIPSMTIENGIDLGTTDSVRKFVGCVLSSFKTKMGVGEAIRFTAEFLYKNETEGTSLGSDVAETETPFIFANATVAMPTGTTLVNVQNLEFNFDQGVVDVRALGSRLASNLIGGARKYSVNLDKTFENSAMLEQAYGSATGPATTVAESNMNIVITNGETGIDRRTIQIQLNGVVPDSHSDPQKPNELITESISLKARTGTGYAMDATSSTPFD